MQQRLGVYGFVSNTCVYFTTLHSLRIFAAEYGTIAHLTYTAPPVYWLAQTGSRTGMVVLMTLFGWGPSKSRISKMASALVVVALTLLALLNMDEVTGLYQRPAVPAGASSKQHASRTGAFLIDIQGGIFTLLWWRILRDATDNTTLGI